MVGKCSLCGGRMVDGHCELCGLDHSRYSREYLNGREKQKKYQKPVLGKKTEAKRMHGTKGGKKKNSGVWIPGILVLLAIVVQIGPDILKIGKGMLYSVEDTFVSEKQTENEEYDPYRYAVREIPKSGSSFETVLGSGTYQVGIDIPEGVYLIECQEGIGAFHSASYDISVYEDIYFGNDSEYGEVRKKEGVRLYDGAELIIDKGMVLRFSTDNAQPIQEAEKT